MDDANNPFTSRKDALKDEKRIKYHNDYLSNLLASIKYAIFLLYVDTHTYVYVNTYCPRKRTWDWDVECHKVDSIKPSLIPIGCQRDSKTRSQQIYIKRLERTSLENTCGMRLWRHCFQGVILDSDTSKAVSVSLLYSLFFCI